jgi:cis-3-alkyl-4-acyloxetan-2-one decarboxylase
VSVAIGAGPSIPAWLEEAFPFNRQTAFWNNQRMHFIDHGDGEPVIMLHGNPTWSFLWRNIIPPVVEAGYRVIVPDLVGLGLSSKPGKVSDYNLDMQVDFIVNLIEGLKLEGYSIVGQDWGGPIVAAVAARSRRGPVHAAVFGNTALAIPKSFKTTAFHRFSHMPVISELAFRGINFPVTAMRKVQGDPNSIGDLEKRAYTFPLPSWGYRAAPLALARMVPNRADHPSLPVLREAETWARGFEGPVGLIWGTKDPILGKALKRMRELFPNASVTETEAGHFLQEEVPDQFAQVILDTLKQVKPAEKAI